MTTALMVHPEEFAGFMAAVTAEARQSVELARSALQSADTVQKITKAGRTLKRECAKLEALEQGYVPVPRMLFSAPSDTGRWGGSTLRDWDSIPDRIVDRLREAQLAGTFDRIGLVTPRRSGGRDPMLIGVIGRGDNEEHYLIGWWR